MNNYTRRQNEILDTIRWILNTEGKELMISDPLIIQQMHQEWEEIFTLLIEKKANYIQKLRTKLMDSEYAFDELHPDTEYKDCLLYTSPSPRD